MLYFLFTFLPRDLSLLQPGGKLTTHFHLVPRSRMVELYLHFPTTLHGVVLNRLSSETILPFTCPYVSRDSRLNGRGACVR
jgi:hypothetical protein